MNKLLSEEIKVVAGLAAVADAFSGTVYSDVVNLAQYEKVCFLVHKAVGTTGTSDITVQATPLATTSNPTAIAFKYRKIDVAAGGSNDTAGAITAATTSGFTTTAGSNQIYLIEVSSSDTPASKPFVHLKAVENANDPVLGGIIILLANPRYEGATLPTAIS